MGSLPRRTPHRRAGAAAAWSAAVLTVVSLLAGCAIVPDGGRVTSATIADRGGQQDVFVELIPPGPQPGWDPERIVDGFLLASGSFAGDHAVAREYLTPPAARSWQPGSSVIEFDGAPTATVTAVASASETFQVGGNLLGNLSEDGQYQAAEQGQSPRTWDFTVVRVKGQWRISDPPDQLLLSKSDVNRTFRSRDLYFYDPSMHVLVPDPVFVPAEVTSADLVAHLVDALRQGPQGWLAAGTMTAFPPGTKLLGTSVDGSTAIVDLGGRVATVSAQQRDQMAAQLLETLAEPPAFPEPSVQSVIFEINGKPVRSPCATPGDPPVLQLSVCPSQVPQVSDARAYYVDAEKRVAALSGPRSDSPVPGPAGSGRVPADQIAVSPDMTYVAAVSGGTLYTGTLAPNGSLAPRLEATSFTSLSWDSADRLWAVGRSGGTARIWRLGPGGQQSQVSLPAELGQVTTLRVAPDGVRVAVITGSGASSRLWLAAIDGNAGPPPAIGQPLPIGTDISAFSDVAWYDVGNLIVLTQPPAGPALYDVPVDGGQSRQIATEPDTVSIAASGSGLLAARSDGTLMQLPNPDKSIWEPVGPGPSPVHGASPVYPG